MRNLGRILGVGLLAAIVVTVIAACGLNTSGGNVAISNANAGVNCTSPSGTYASQARSLEACQQGQDTLSLTRNQPIHQYSHSQLRQEVIDIEDWQASGATSTAFFYSNDGKVLFSCPSIGPPVPSDTQLTNPNQAVWNNGGQSPAGVGIGNPDPTGVYTGQSTGTYVMCVDPNGATYATYWEGYVMEFAGPATIGKNGQPQLTGQPSSLFSDVKATR